MTDHAPGLLAQAHLANHRGNHAEALDLVAAHIELHPTDADALELRDQVEQAIVEGAAAENAERETTEMEQVSGPKIVSYGVIGVVSLALAIWLTVDTVCLGLRVGFSTEVNDTMNTIIRRHMPVHMGFFRPLLLLAVGLACLRSVYLNLREFASGK